jgi:hypothetical protein
MRSKAPSVALAPMLVPRRLWLALAVFVLAACGRTRHEPTASPAAAEAPSSPGTEGDHGAAGAAASRGSFNDCPELAEAVEAAFAAKRACSVAADCTLMWPGCPFGCCKGGVCDMPPEPPRPRAKLLRIPRER